MQNETSAEIFSCPTNIYILYFMQSLYVSNVYTDAGQLRSQQSST